MNVKLLMCIFVFCKIEIKIVYFVFDLLYLKHIYWSILYVLFEIFLKVFLHSTEYM